METRFNGISIGFLAGLSLFVLLVNWVPDYFSGITFDVQYFGHDFMAINSSGSSHLDFTLDYLGDYLTTVAVVHWVFVLLRYQQPMEIPAKVVALGFLVLAWKEVFDLVVFDNENPPIYDRVVLVVLCLVVLPLQYGNWTLKNVQSDNFEEGHDAVYRVFLLPVDLMDLVLLIPGVGVGGFKLLTCKDGEYYLTGYKSLTNYYTSEPISLEHVKQLLRHCVIIETRIKNVSGWLAAIKRVRCTWDPVIKTCVGTPMPTLIKFGCRVYSRYPSIELLFLLKEKYRNNARAHR